ncbi:MAG: ClpXP protease specificity-enhancing factor [Zoogloeaceae bacterium]|nr:ClpXP protease specificity-enhancing factor [Zoogloeaceae bacterium]
MTTVSTKPYLIRAIHEWCVDQGLTPHIAVVIDRHVIVPNGYARDGQIILNLSPDATSQLVIGNETITFQARFGGKAHALLVPIANVIAVYAAQNGQGMAFEPESIDEQLEAAEQLPDDAPEAVGDAPGEGGDEHKPKAPPRRNHLKVVK